MVYVGLDFLDPVVKGELHPKPKLSMFYVLSQYYRHFKKQTNKQTKQNKNNIRPEANRLRRSKMTLKLQYAKRFLSYWSKYYFACFDQEPLAWVTKIVMLFFFFFFFFLLFQAICFKINNQTIFQKKFDDFAQFRFGVQFTL